MLEVLRKEANKVDENKSYSSKTYLEIERYFSGTVVCKYVSKD